MAGEFDAIAGQAGAVAASIGTGLGWLLVLGFIGVAIWGVYYIISHKHEVKLRVKTKRGKFIVGDKAKCLTGIDGNYWHLLRFRKKIPAPPAEAIEVTKNGRYFAEGYYDEDDGNITWIIDHENVGGKQLAPYTTQQRALLVHGSQEAVRRRKKGWLDTFKELAIPFAFVTIILMMFLFWSDIAQPAKDMAASSARLSSKTMEFQTELTQQNAIIARQNAMLYRELTGRDVVTIEMPQEVQAE